MGVNILESACNVWKCSNCEIVHNNNMPMILTAKCRASKESGGVFLILNVFLEVGSVGVIWGERTYKEINQKEGKKKKETMCQTWWCYESRSPVRKDATTQPSTLGRCCAVLKVFTIIIIVLYGIRSKPSNRGTRVTFIRSSNRWSRQPCKYGILITTLKSDSNLKQWSSNSLILIFQTYNDSTSNICRWTSCLSTLAESVWHTRYIVYKCV